MKHEQNIQFEQRDSDYLDNGWNSLKAAGLTYPYPYWGEEVELHYGPPLHLSEKIVHELESGAAQLWDIVLGKIEHEHGGSITSWLEETGNPPLFDHEVLNNPEVNRQFEERINAGWLPFMTYDVLLSYDPTTGEVVPKVLESQTAVAYAGWFRQMLDAWGEGSNLTEKSYSGESDPIDVLGQIRELATPGEDIVVIDLNPFTGPTSGDQKIMAMALSGLSPISILDIQMDESGVFYYISTDGQRRELKNVLCRMLQSDLDATYWQIETGPGSLLEKNRRIKTIKEFLNNADINWIWHPSWQNIINKATLPQLASEIADSEILHKHIPACLYSGELLSTPGYYILKPRDGSSGYGQFPLYIGGSITRFKVPAGYIAQPCIEPYPIQIEGGLFDSYQAEIRYQPVMGREHSSYIMGRVAPLVESPIVQEIFLSLRESMIGAVESGFQIDKIPLEQFVEEMVLKYPMLDHRLIAKYVQLKSSAYAAHYSALKHCGYEDMQIFDSIRECEEIYTRVQTNVGRLMMASYGSGADFQRLRCEPVGLCPVLIRPK